MKKHLLASLLLMGYCFFLIKIMVFKDVPLIRIGVLMLNFGGTHEGPPNLIPFKTILPYLMGEKGLLIAGINIIGNIILLVPVGFLVPYVLREINWKKSFLFSIASGFFIEGMQTVLHVGIFDIDDVILNGLGYMIGYWKFLVFPQYWQLLKSSRIFLFSVIFILGIGIYFIYNLFQYNPSDVRPHPNVQNKIVDGPKNDLCGGTGGTGKIVEKIDHAITIQRNDGVKEVIHLTSKTAIKNSRGDASEEELKLGDRVTVVVGLIKEDPQAASLVLICLN